VAFPANTFDLPEKLPLLGNCSCVALPPASMLTPLTYMIHMDVVNADIAGANTVPTVVRVFVV